MNPYQEPPLEIPGQLNLSKLLPYQNKPAPFTPGEPMFWDDPYISTQMLTAHLDPETDLASRKPTTIDLSVAWIVDALKLLPGDQVLDLGCGPGLYARRLAQLRLDVTGIDISRRSIAYARQYAHEHALSITYRHEDYLALQDDNQYDAALLIFGDFCTLNPHQRQQLLQNVGRALKPGGHFVLDVSTRLHRDRHGLKHGWYLSAGGFWWPGPHLVLEEGFDYPDKKVYLNQYIVVADNGSTTVYRNWFQDYTPETIVEELKTGGFTVQGLWADLSGMPIADNTEWIGVVAEKTSQS